ncbi:MAG: ABC transporter permease [Lachnospiraceae bacterium]|nr:ABC transporter permease [Lachnospiraceae bacterium]
MSVFNAIIKSIKANASTIIMYLVIFAVFGNMSSRANVSTKEEMFKEVTTEVAVTDHDGSDLSRALVGYLEETQKVVDPKTEDPVVMNDNVRFGIYDYALIIPEGFEEKLVNGQAEDAIDYISPGDTASGYLLTQKLSDYLQDVVIYLNCGYSKEEAIALTHEQMVELADIEATILDDSDTGYRSFYAGMFTFNGYTLMLIICICCAMALTFVKDRDVKNRISVSGMHFSVRNLATICATMLIGFVLTTFVIVIVYLMGLQYHGEKLLYYSIDAYALMLISLGMAYFICSITSNENLINMIANMLGLSFSFLCGIFVDPQFMSEGVLRVARFMPLYWYAEAIRYINDTPVSEILVSQFGMYLLIEVIFAIGFFAAGLIISRKKEQYAL